MYVSYPSENTVEKKPDNGCCESDDDAWTQDIEFLRMLDAVSEKKAVDC